MFTSSPRPWSRSLENGLVLKSLSTLEEVERLAEFNGIIHGSPVAGMTRRLILDHPATRPEHWLFVEEEATRRMVASLCLLPWRWRYEDVDLKAGEMGIVGTLQEYRGQGLIRALDRRFKELLREGEYVISHIQGIPYFYRQFGYEYAIPLEQGWRIELYQIPGEPVEGFTFRMAVEDDLPILMELHREAASDLAISAYRSEEEWRYLLGPALQTETAGDPWLVLDETGRPAGYWIIQRFGFGEGLNISEVSRLSSSAACAVLGQLKALAVERNKPYIRIHAHDSCSLIQAATGMEASFQGRYAWQIHLPDVPRLLRQLAPVLERRLAHSAFAGLTRPVPINLYRESLVMTFEAGKLARVETCPGYRDEGEIRIPPTLLAPLILGWRSRADLDDIYPDFGVWGQSRPLIDTLFPKMSSFIYTIY